MRSSEPERSRSAALFARGQRVIPGGNARLAARQTPHPVYLAHGTGAVLTDVDGNRYLDFLNNFTALVHGHAYPPVVQALRRQAGRGASFGGPTESEIELAELLISRVPAFERVRFMSSGTEAVMYAVKAARAYTGRPKIAKFEGAFHGSYDPVEGSLDAGPENWGESGAPRAVPFCRGTPASLLSDTVVLPLGDLDAVREILAAHEDELAAVLIDPLPQRVGLIAIDPAHLDFLRAFTLASGALLISDEVMSFRLSHQGGLGRFGIEADLAAIGKIIGGGMPVGAVAGPARFMAAFEPGDGKPPVPQSGTFSANPMSMVAGTAAMRGMTEASFEALEALGEYARATVTEALRRHELPYCVTGMASMFRLHLRPDPPRNYRDCYLSPEQGGVLARLVRALQARGILVSPTCQFCLSTPMTRDHVDEMAASVVDSAKALRDQTS